jgi:hypothetical protein
VSDVPPELQPRRDELHDKVVRRARALRRRHVGAIAIVTAIVVAIPTAAIALNAGANSPSHSRVAVSGDPTTEPTTTASTDTTTTTIETTTTTPPSTINATVTSPATKPAETSTTSLLCHNSMNPACGPLRYVPPVTDKAATLDIVKISPTTPTVGEPVTFTFHATDPDSHIEMSAMWCNNGGYSFGDESLTTHCESVCAGVPGYGPWDPPLPQPSDVTFTLKHTYDKAGTFQAKFGITAEPCGSRASKASTAISVVVTAAATSPTT